MADVVFLETVQQSRDRDLCHVVEIMYELGKTVLVHTLSTAGASHFDNLLWTFHKESFVPHRIGRPEAPEDMALERVIIVVNKLPTPIAGDVLIFAEEADVTLLGALPWTVHFVVLDDDSQKQKSRALWKDAARLGLELHHVPRRERERWREILAELVKR